MTSIEKLIDILESTLDSSWQLPMSGGKVVLDIHRIRDAIEELKENLPGEIVQAKKIVQDRSTIIEKTKNEAEFMLRTSEEKIKSLINKNEITKAAQARAESIVSEAESRAKEIRKSSEEYAQKVMKHLEETITSYLTEIRTIQKAFKSDMLESKS